MGFFSKIKAALRNTSDKLTLAISGKKIDQELKQDIEDALIMADVGVEASTVLSEKVISHRFSSDATEDEVRQFLADEIASMLKPYEIDFFESEFSEAPKVLLIIGVNGNGKTTTASKIANLFRSKSPLLVAADTFRAAATEQLKFWANRLQIDICSAQSGADAAGLVYSAIEQAKVNNNKVVIVDTAGRMQNRDDLLAELEKIKRVIAKQSVQHKTILVLDGVTGQAAHSQVSVFLQRIGVNGVIITKLDGTAKGGAIVSLTQKYKLPVLAIGVGEDVNDLKPFKSKEFSAALLGVETR